MYLSRIQLTKKQLKFRTSVDQGRNNQGKITVRHRERGHKKLYRKIENNFNNISKGLVLNIEYNPYHSNFLARVLYRKNNTFKYYYVPCNNKLNVLQHIRPVTGDLKPDKLYNEGYPFLLKNLSVGDLVCNIEKRPNQGSTFARSAGTYGQIVEFDAKKKGLVCIQLPSKEQYYVSENCTAILGRNANRLYQNLQKWKAGTSRHIGKRPHVRGVVMNPVDHPHGGGEGKTSTKRPPVTPEGFLTKGVPTRKPTKNNFFIALSRKYINKKN